MQAEGVRAGVSGLRRLVDTSPWSAHLLFTFKGSVSLFALKSNFLYLFIFDCVGLRCCVGFSLVAVSRDYSSCCVWTSFVAEHRL